MEETIDSKPLQKTIEEVDILHYTLLEAIPSSCIMAQEGMEIAFPKEDPIIGGLPMRVEEAKHNNTDRSGVDLAPHAE